MPIRERECAECELVYEVLSVGSRVMAGELAHEMPDGEVVCSRCHCPDFTTLFSTQVAVTGLGGDAGVGKFFPYYDRGLGTGNGGRGLLVRNAQHRRWLLDHKPSGAKRESRLIPLETNSDSGLRGTWDDIASRDESEREVHEAEYKEVIGKMEYENREQIAKVGVLPLASDQKAVGGP